MGAVKLSQLEAVVSRLSGTLSRARDAQPSSNSTAPSLTPPSPRSASVPKLPPSGILGVSPFAMPVHFGYVYTLAVPATVGHEMPYAVQCALPMRPGPHIAPQAQAQARFHELCKHHAYVPPWDESRLREVSCVPGPAHYAPKMHAQRRSFNIKYTPDEMKPGYGQHEAPRLASRPATRRSQSQGRSRDASTDGRAQKFTI